MHTTAKWLQSIIDLSKLTVTAAIVLVAAGNAFAGDHIHQCRSADGLYSMNDEELQVFDTAKGHETGPAIPYKVLRRIQLSLTDGFCIANAAPKGQRRFKYSASNYAMQVRFRRGGVAIETFMLCEMASSGLPASYNCDKDVQTSIWIADKSTSAKDGNGKSGGTRWMHNGSEVRIVANGPRRRIVYVTPRDGLLKRGVKPGDVIFEGERSGDRYRGQAYVFTANCGAVPYEVSGRVQKGERRVVVSGRMPRVNSQCKAKSWRDDRLVFDRE